MDNPYLLSNTVCRDFLSDPMSIVLAIILPLLLIFIFSRKLQQKHGKKYHPIGGTIFNQLLNFNRLQHYMTDLAGSIRPTGCSALLGMRSIQLTKQMLSIYLKQISTIMASILKDLLGDGIFTVDGGKWRQQRKVSSYEFSTKILRNYSSIIFQKNVAKLAHILYEVAKSNQIMDIQVSMLGYSDSIFKVAFGVELDSMCASSEECNNFGKAFDDSSALILWRYVDIFWQMKRFLNIGSEAALKKNIEVVDNFVYKLIHIKVQRMHDSENDSAMKKEDILSSLQDKVAQEVKEATKMSEIDNFAEFAASMNEETLGKMQNLHAAITETIRLYPPLPVDAKICFSDDTLPDGFSVRKGDMVAHQPYAMGRMRFIWGNDAEEFKPERWLDEDGLFRQESPFKFTAFQGGPRICLGICLSADEDLLRSPVRLLRVQIKR
ncbi:hypothetical protein RGQ29_028561 [Quercus rubra]|uniref:Cytochrome P450 n=1 Tax=Quercus rubra TaxID=3512 RepID=A0AAN7IM76_QUERU|nr:hypothetical protein RGQ29_028561 [Quercus rubra]